MDFLIYMVNNGSFETLLYIIILALLFVVVFYLGMSYGYKLGISKTIRVFGNIMRECKALMFKQDKYGSWVEFEQAYAEVNDIRLSQGGTNLNK